jgi:hypothetical protein
MSKKTQHVNKRRRSVYGRSFVRFGSACAATLLLFSAFQAGSVRAAEDTAVALADGPRYARSFQASDGTIYLMGPLKSTDGGKRIAATNASDPQWGSILSEKEINTFFYRKGLFLAVASKTVCGEEGRCYGRIWRSKDGLKTIQQEETVLVIPEAGKVDRPGPGVWVGIFFHRQILELPDGSLLAAMYGNFEQDKIRPTNPRSIGETKYKARTFTARSTDEGRTWHYVASVAVPSPDVVDDTEGFNEWTIAQLDDGRLFGVMRTGHYTALVASWSSDNGKTWTTPVVPEGLDPGGCDPYLLKLTDGRLALAYGQIVPPKGSKEKYWKEYETGADHRRRCRLAINDDGTGKSWKVSTVADYAPRSAYPSIFEVQPNMIVYQSDLNLWRVKIPAPKTR